MSDTSAWDITAPLQPAPADGAAPGFERTWKSVDLTNVLSGSYQRPEPTVGRRMDNVGILYPGKVHTLASESEAGKTWFALELAHQEIRDGHDVVYLDFEDDEGSVVGRLLTMQADPALIAEHFHYVRPTSMLGHAINVDDLRASFARQPTLAVLDGVTEAMTLHGLNPLDNADIAEFGRQIPRRIASWGPAVLALDHVTKDRETRGRYAIGGVHKLNALDGAAFLLEKRTAIGVGMTGKSTIRIAKDRPGQLRRHSLPAKNGLHWYGDLVVEFHGDSWADVTIEAASERAEEFRPTVLMAKAYALIATKAGEKGVSGRNVQAGIGGNSGAVRQAISLLELDGYISASPHRPLKFYDPDEETS